MSSAALRLRGREGPLDARITWPEGDAEAIVVIIGDTVAPPVPNAVTLRVRCATHQDVRTVIEWTEDHAHELGVPPGRVIVAS